MKRAHRSLNALLALTLIPSTSLLWSGREVRSQTTFGNMCATPGKDGIDSGTISVVNSYFPGTASINAGATSITVGAINSSGNQTAITAGDLLLVIQMQDADINFTDTSNYGAGTGTGSGVTTLNNTGRYEYIVALNSVGTSGGLVPIRGAGSGGGLINGYRQRAANVASNGKSTYQIIRVPQYTDVSLSGTIRAPGAWNGTSGGIVALDVAGTFTMNNGQIDVKDKGFRGGGGTTITDTYPAGEDESYRTSGATRRGGMKGEGIAGTPLITFNGQEVNGILGLVDTGIDGYPRLQSQDNVSYSSTTNGTANGGSRGRGAPGNAGGGGNQHNAGGGGGGNRGVGGQGGNSINSPPATENPATGVSKPVGGKGGSAMTAALDRIIMGGGGGAGDANNGIAGSGGPGGGIVMVRAGAIIGSGLISATAKDGLLTPTDDGGAGAGAGGSIVITAKGGSLANITLSAQGGKGGDANTATTVPYDFGPGGGGGGGVIYSSLPTGSTNVSGGQPGKSFNGQLGGTTGVTRGAQPGTPGQVFTSVAPTQIPGIQSGTDCSATLSGSVWDDLDGSITQTTGENGTNAGGLFAYAVNGSGQVVARAIVQASGTYSLLVPNNASYTLRLSTDGSRNPGQSAPIASLPNGWNHTGENLNGTPETITPGEIAVTVGTNNVINQNFGIRQEASPAAGTMVINEVLFRQTGGTSAAANDEFIELYNASNAPVDISGWQLLDGNLIANDTDGGGGINGGPIGGA
ncbi:MAG: lamin tail domain-containing protein, partial [Thermosynechococcaceae cyanobacterium]